MAIEKKVLPVAPWKGLYVDGMTLPGGLSQAENIDILPNGWAKRRMPTRTLDDALTVKASQGLKELVEFRNAAGTRYLFADMNISTTMKIMGADVTGTTDYECGTWADVITGLTAGTSILPQYAVMQDRLFRVDGTNSQYVFTTNAAYTNNGVAAPAAAPTVASTTGGSMTAGEYNCYYTYVKKDGTYVVESNPCPVANITIAGSAINVTIVSSSDDDVTHIRLYRTLYGLPDGHIYYDKEVAKAVYVATPIQQFNVADASLTSTTLSENNSVPPTAIGMAVAGNRMFYLTKTAVYWSKIEAPEIVPAAWYSAIDPNDGDLGMAICAMQNYVLVFKRHKTFMYDANSAEVVDSVVGIARHIISTDIGCMAANSVQSCGEQNCIMWLSHEGVMKWSGGEITNVSKDRVSSIIDDIMFSANSEYYIDSAYYGKRYHLLLVERNSAGTSITDERHLVYNFETDSWTEYKYYSDGATTRYYETNLAVSTDSNKRDVFLSIICKVANATLAYVNQNDYDPAGTSVASAEVLDSAGDSVTTFDVPIFSYCDSSDNLYVIADNLNIFKVTSAGGKSTIATAAQVKTALGETWSITPGISSVVNDSTNSCFYIIFEAELVSAGIRVTYAGAISEVYLLNDYIGLNSTGTILYGIYDGNALYKITSPGQVGEAAALVYHVGNYTDEYNNWNISTAPRSYLYDDDVYIVGHQTVAGVGVGNWYLFVISDIDGTPSHTSYDTGLSCVSSVYSIRNIFVVSSSELYLKVQYGGKYYIYKGSLIGNSWSFSQIVGPLTMPGDFPDSYNNIQKNTAGDFLVVGSGDAALVYDSNWELKNTISTAGVTDCCSVTHRIGSAAAENIFYITGYTTDNVYIIYPATYWPDVAENARNSTFDPYGVYGKIVSNYEDLSIPNYKRITRSYLETESEYAICGEMALESDFTTNRSIHTTAEATEPDGSVCREVFASGGQETWDTDDTFNSGTVENWETHRLDIGLQGQKFRYSIEFGDISGASQGTMYLKPPMIEMQVRGVKGKD
jgi:hypothetical protein